MDKHNELINKYKMIIKQIYNNTYSKQNKYIEEKEVSYINGKDKYKKCT